MSAKRCLNSVPSHRHRAVRAFTLFELSLCLMIIGIIAAALVPIIGNNIRSSRLRTAANVLAADIDYCSSICISRAKATNAAAISFDTAHNKYTLIDVASGATLKHPADSSDFVNDFATGRNAQYADVVLKSITAGSNPVTALTFDCYGKPAASADVVITLTYNMQTLTVTVKASTGDITISG